jgi:hypothetical protein
MTSVDVPQWALFDIERRSFLIREESGNPIFRSIELDVSDPEQLD